MVAVALSIAFVTQTIRINFHDFYIAAYSASELSHEAMFWSLEWSPLFAYWDWPESNFLLLPRILVGHGGYWLQTVAVVIIIGLTSTTYRMMRIFSSSGLPLE